MKSMYKVTFVDVTTDILIEADNFVEYERGLFFMLTDQMGRVVDRTLHTFLP